MSELICVLKETSPKSSRQQKVHQNFIYAFYYSKSNSCVTLIRKKHVGTLTPKAHLTRERKPGEDSGENLQTNISQYLLLLFPWSTKQWFVNRLLRHWTFLSTKLLCQQHLIRPNIYFQSENCLRYREQYTASCRPQKLLNVLNLDYTVSSYVKM